MNFFFKKKSKKPSYLIPIAIAIVFVTILIVFYPDGFEGEVVELALVTPSDFSCKAWSAFSDHDTSGGIRSYNPVTVDFKSFTKLGVLSVSGKPLSFVDTSTYTECKSLNSNTVDIYLVGGTVRTSFFAINESGQYVFLKQVDKTLPTQPRLVLDTKQIIPSGTISGTEINSKMTSSKEYFDTKLRIAVNVELKFSQAGKIFNTNAGGGLMSASIPIKLYNPVTTPVASTSNVVDLKRLSQTVFDLKDYSTRTLLVTATGELPQWRDSEGSPFVKLIDPSGKVVGSFGMTSKKLISSSTNTYEFSTTNLVIPKSPLGIWKIEMHSNNDVRKTSSVLPSTDVMILQTYDSTVKLPPVSNPTPTPTQTSGQQQCNSIGKTWNIYSKTLKPAFCGEQYKVSNGNLCEVFDNDIGQCTVFNPIGGANPPITPPPSNQNNTGIATAFIAYKLTYDQGGIEVGQSPSEGPVNIQLSGLNFIGQPKGEDEKLETITLIETVDAQPLNGATITNLQTKTKFNILVDGIPISVDGLKLNAGQLKKIGTYSIDKNYYLMNQITVSTVDLKQFLTSNNYFVNCSGLKTCNELKNGQIITIQSTTDGTFDYSSSSGFKSVGFTGLSFNRDLKYATDFDPEPCKGLSGEELLFCRGGDPNNCVDLIEVQGDENCDIKEEQTGGICQGLTPQECKDLGKSNPGTSFENFDDVICNLLGNCDSGPKTTVNVCNVGETSQQCIDRLKSSIGANSNNQLFGMNPEMFMLLSFFGVIIIIILIVLVSKK